jgi:ABC-type glycerol-3-phosphate transport system substrate-binding protein
MKHTAKLLLAAMVLALTSCGSEAASVDSTETMNGSETVVESETTAENPFDTLESIDFGGRDFTFVGRLSYEDELCIDEATGDVLDDAVFLRNQRVMEKFNVNFKWEIGTSEYSDLGKTAILAGEDVYDALMIHSRMAFNFMQQELLHDWNEDMPYNNLSAPWWSQDMRENIAIGNKIYFMSGDISYYFLADTQIMLFNKQVFTDLGLDFPYQTVRDGKWTFETMTQLAKQGTWDVNGDGKIDAENDHIGYITTKWRGPNFCYIAQGTRLVTLDKDKLPQLTLNVERAADIYMRYMEFLNSDSALMNGEVESAEMMQQWMSGRVMFFDGLLKYASNMRDMEDDFGIIPLPKYDEAQDVYYSTPGAGINFFAVPITVEDTECVSAILEGLAILGHQDIIPTYYDTVLKSKYSRDEESAEMLDLIHENIIVDFGAQIYSHNSNKLNSIGYFLSEGKENFASFYAENEGVFLDCLDEVISLTY